MEDRSPDSPIRIWIAGCATGEEAYSITIVLLEFLGNRVNQPKIQIFATDISELALKKARSGIYLANALVNVSPERLRRFFVPIEGGYQSGKLVHKLCVFARQDITIDPPFSHLDLVTCRNVLIYLGARLQRQELAATKDYLQSIIEDQEATHQDLKVANEEILSSSEELQSTNEELETCNR